MAHRVPGRLLAALCLAAACGAGAQPQAPGPQASGPQAPGAPAGGYAPVRGQSGKDVVWIASPDAVVERMLRMAEVGPQDRVVDLGSGDGKIAIAAARRYGARALGLEFNPQLVELSTQRAREAGVAARVSFQRADIFAADLAGASVVTLYLLPELNLRLRPRLLALPPGTRIVSNAYGMGDWAPDETARPGTAEVFLWRVPANVSGHWRVSTGGLPDAPDAFRFTQRYQEVRGDAVFGDLGAGLVRPQLSGSTLTFAVRDAAGAMLRFTGRADGDRIVGAVARGTAAPVTFEATRTEGAAPLAGPSGAAAPEASVLRD